VDADENGYRIVEEIEDGAWSGGDLQLPGLVELLPDLLHRHSLHGPRLSVTGVVDEHLDGSLSPFDLIDRRAHRVLVGHVEGQEFATTLFERS
jgi:hypothetical protein